MNIGYDGKRIFQNRTGLGNYSRSLLSILTQYYPQHTYTLFSPKATGLFNAEDFSNIHTITPSSFISKKIPSLWRRRFVTKDIAASGVQIYHGVSNELPLGIERLKIKTVVTVHDLVYERHPETYHFDERYVHRFKIRKACKVADRIIAISRQTKNDLVEFYGIDEKKISLCYQSCNPIFMQKISNEEKMRVKERYNLPDRFFLFVSSITKRKNLISVCKAMLALKDKTTTPLVIIGDGKKEKEEVVQFMKANGMPDQLLFLNELPVANQIAFKSAADFPAIYQQALALIYPSVFEGFGMPVLEALCSGLPVICSNSSSLPEVGGDAPLYFSPLNIDELAEQILKVATNRDICESMRVKGLEHAAHFSHKKYADNTINIYEELLC